MSFVCGSDQCLQGISLLIYLAMPPLYHDGTICIQEHHILWLGSNRTAISTPFCLHTKYFVLICISQCCAVAYCISTKQPELRYAKSNIWDITNKWLLGFM